MRIFGSVGFGPFRIGASTPLRRRSRARYWTHGTCTIRHRTPEAANRCKGTR